MEKSILLIENDEYTTAKLEEYLGAFGFHLNATKNGQFALSILRSQRPDLILISDGVNDIAITAFLDRKRKMVGVEDIPTIVLTNKTQTEHIKSLIHYGARDTLSRPVILERLKKKIFQQLHIPEKTEDRHLTTEVFIREGIIIVELGGSIVNDELVSLKYRILDTARTDQTIKKRFYIIIYKLEEAHISQSYFDKLFDFISYYPRLPHNNVKILTSDPKIIGLIKNSGRASKFEIVNNYIEGLNKLKSLYLVNEENEVLVEFLKPNTALFKNVYDKKGTLIKEEGKSFSPDEIRHLLSKGIKKLYYTRKAKVGNDKQILENEDVDVVMDYIKVSGIVVPKELTDSSLVHESIKQHGINILIVNSNQDELNTLNKFFTSKGFITTGVTSSRSALENIRRIPYKYVIIDLDLDKGNGLNLVKTLKLSPNAKESNFIITGKFVKSESVEHAIQLGVQGFLKSPFDPEKLSKIIK